jgi:hypothetical protein
MAYNATEICVINGDDESLTFSVGSSIVDAVFVVQLQIGTDLLRKSLGGSDDVTLSGGVLTVKIDESDFLDLGLVPLTVARYSLITTDTDGKLNTFQHGDFKIFYHGK